MRQSKKIRAWRIRIIFGISLMALLFVVSMSAQAVNPGNSGGVTGGPFGDSMHVGQVTVNNGKVVGATNVLITGTVPGGPAGGALTGTYPNPQINTDAVPTYDGNGHVKYTGGTPTTSCDATVTGTDNAGLIAFTADAVPFCFIQFNQDYDFPPGCVVSSTGQVRITTGTGGFSIDAGAGSFSIVQVVYYNCTAL